MRGFSPNLPPDLVVKNTFIHHAHDNPSPCSLRRIKSESDISSDSASPLPDAVEQWKDELHSHKGQGSLHEECQSNYSVPVEGAPHVLFSSSSSQATSNFWVPVEGTPHVPDHVFFSSSEASASGASAGSTSSHLQSTHLLKQAFKETISLDTRNQHFKETFHASSSSGTPAQALEAQVFQSNSSAGSSVKDSHPAPQQAQGKPPSVGSLSVGSVLHNEGLCRPCHYFLLKGGCTNGEQCEFCHLPHKKWRPRPCKEQRQGYKRLLARMDDAQNPIQAVTDAINSAKGKPYLINKLSEKKKELQKKMEERDRQRNPISL